MSGSRRFLFVLLSGLLVASGSFVAILTGTGDTTVRVMPDSPILQQQPVTTETTAVTVAEVPETTAPRPPPAPKAPRVRSGEGAPRPQAPPRNPYAAEPIVEIGSIEIPKIGLHHRVWQGISLRNIDNGPSHWPGTALPGQVGNAVFAGHRVTHSKPFRNIDQLEPGDHVIFTIDGVRSVYEVTGSEIVPPTALHIVDQTSTPTATLFACHPPGSARQRYVVRLALVTE